MAPKTAGWDELHLAENPAVELLESLGYAYVSPEDLDGEPASFKETILTRRRLDDAAPRTRERAQPRTSAA